MSWFVVGDAQASASAPVVAAKKRFSFGSVLGKLFKANDTRDFEDVLLAADFGPKIAEQLQQRIIDASDRRAALHAALVDMLRHGESPLRIDPRKQPFIILFVGVNGNGKTTLLGKAAAALQAAGLNPLVVAADTFRAAAVKQAAAWAERAGATFMRGADQCDAAGLVYDACVRARCDGHSVVLVDTAGCLHNKQELVAELRKIVKVVRKFDPTGPHEIIQVIDAGTGQNALIQADVFRDAADVTGYAITKLDGTAKGGTAAALVQTMRLPIYMLGTGEGIDDVAPFNAHAYADALLEEG